MNHWYCHQLHLHIERNLMNLHNGKKELNQALWNMPIFSNRCNNCSTLRLIINMCSLIGTIVNSSWGRSWSETSGNIPILLDSIENRCLPSRDTMQQICGGSSVESKIWHRWWVHAMQFREFNLLLSALMPSLMPILFNCSNNECMPFFIERDRSSLLFQSEIDHCNVLIIFQMTKITSNRHK